MDQSTISRYLEFVKTILLEILPTAKKIQNAKGIGEIKHLVRAATGASCT